MPLRELINGTGPNGEGSPEVDIVAVHGLNPFNSKTHSFDTWTKKSKGSSKLWLRDDLPTVAPQARIFIYEYDSFPALTQSKRRFVDEANSFLECLDNERYTCPNRPLILIAHSLGGILVKQAMVNAFNNPHYAVIKDATRGLVFFGTPHAGGKDSLVTLGQVCAGIVNTLLRSAENDIMQAVRGGSLYADTLQDIWRHQLKDYHIVSFYEGVGNIVSKESASFGLPGDIENIVSLDADHSNMCRFDIEVQKDLDNLKLVRGNLRRLYRTAVSHKTLALPSPPTSVPQVALNESPTGFDLNASLQGPDQRRPLVRSNTLSANSEVDIPILLEEEPLNEPPSSQHRHIHSLLPVLRNIAPIGSFILPTYVKSFHHYDYAKVFDQINGERYPATCEWIIQNEDITWWCAQRRSSLLWLSGDPGIGKSTLLTHLVHLLQGRPRRLDVGKRSAVVYSFCNQQTNHTASMIISVAIHQMLMQIPKLQGSAFEFDKVNCLGNSFFRIMKGKNRSAAMLWHLFCHLVRQSRLDKVFLVVDALDECTRESQVELIRLFYGNVPGMKILVSSRPDEDLNITLSRWSIHSPGTLRKLNAEDQEAHVKEDIDRYIQGEVARIGDIRAYSLQQRKMVIDKLTKDRSRIFLPVALLFRKLERAQSGDLVGILEETPNDLQVLYHKLLSQIPLAIRSRPSALFKFIMYSYTPLTVKELAFACSTNEDRARSEEMLGGFLSDTHISSFRKNLLQYGPMLKIRQDDDTVNFIHVSAKEFLIKRSIASSKESFLVRPRQAHKDIALDCLRLLLSKARLPLPESWSRDHLAGLAMVSQHVLLSYALKYWYKHLIEATSSMMSVDDVDPELLAQVRELTGLWQQAPTLGFRSLLLSYIGFNILNEDEVRQTSPIQVLSALGLSIFLQVLLRDNFQTIHSATPHVQSALTLAIKGGHESTVDLLVEQFNISSLDGDAFDNIISDSAWSGQPTLLKKIMRMRKPRTRELVQATTAAFLTGKRETLQTLTQDRSIFEDRNHFDMTVLHVLFVEHYSNGQMAPGVALAIALYFIENGVDIGARDVVGNTALHYVCWSMELCTKPLIEGLVQNGADPHCRNKGGLTPFHLAARYAKYTDAIEALLHIDSDRTDSLVAAASNGQMTPLHWAVGRWCQFEYDEPIILALLRHGANIQALNSKGVSPLQLASGSNMRYILQSIYTALDGVQHIAIDYEELFPDHSGIFERWATDRWRESEEQLQITQGGPNAQDANTEAWSSRDDSNQSFVTAPQSIISTSTSSGSRREHFGGVRGVRMRFKRWWRG